ncbi:LacI family transcriptional regulator [Amycolatopsis rhizosphaerae]|uniref:LacI family transcriptional regulator n=1 Tax=Amycolatopsis rhizosphaerae TaxID=2053003 RepID=A0A558CAG2_9PSEU|nr:LacI family DNA-binding transcriptional regulator [Amycolatopsis rhizosphaerae]TVT45602.1 LacI family transcriptional regulator [Amycolatopsis rhizosphaerae]
MPIDHATIYDVANRAGVSISTVSLTLNRPHRVNATTRQRVLDAIEELGYVPKETAMARARKTVGRVGVLAPFSSYDSYSRRLKGILREAKDDATEIVIYDQESAASAASPFLSALPVTRRLDGVIIMGLPLEDQLAERLLSQGLPTVLVDSTRPELDSITVDDHAAGYLVGKHLVDTGRRSFAYISEAQRSDAFLSPGQMRRSGLRRAAADAGVNPDQVRHVITPNNIAGGKAAVERLVQENRLPDAIFAHQDALAAGVLLECKKQGIQVPEDMAVVGFDDGELAESLEMTTIRQPLEKSGQLGFRHLREALAGKGGPARHVTLNVELVIRGTT